MMKQSIRGIDVNTLLSKKGLSGLWAMIKGYRIPFFCAVISLGLASCARVSGFYLLRYIIDEILGRGIYMEQIWFFGLAFVGLAAFEGGFLFLRGVSAAYYSEAIIYHLRTFLFDHIQHLSFTYHDHADSGKLLQRVTEDVDAVNLFYNEQATEIGRIITLFLLSFIAMIFLNPSIALLSILCIPLVILQSIWFFKQIDREYEVYQEQESVVTSVLRENILGVRVVRGCSQQENEKKKFDKENSGKLLCGKRLVKYHAAYWPISDIICVIQILVVYTAGAILTIHATISIGTYMAICGLVIWIIWPMRNLGRVVVQASSGAVSFRRVMQILKEEREVQVETEREERAVIRGAIEFCRVSFRYREGDQALHNISFTCKPGEVIALVGETGSGKTTIVNLLLRFYHHYTGNIYIDGRELKTIPLPVLRREIGIVEQEPFLFSCSIRENIAYGAGTHPGEQDIIHAAKAASIHDMIESLPDKYNTLVGERGVTLSGGQKQRIAIARTLLKNPAILILDDATSEVDTITAHRIEKAIIRLIEGRTCLVIAHRIQTLMRADRILVLRKGSIIQSGKHSELIKCEGLYRNLYTIQCEGIHRPRHNKGENVWVC